MNANMWPDSTLTVRAAKAAVLLPMLLLLAPSLLPQSIGQEAAGDSPSRFTAQELEWFEREVRPVLAAECYSCHSDDAGVRKGGLLLDSMQAMLAGGDSGPAIVPGKPDESLLIEAIRRESYEMPPEKPLEPSDRRALERWVEMGAPWPAETTEQQAGDWFEKRLASHWAWQPVRTPAIPSGGPYGNFALRGGEQKDHNALKANAVVDLGQQAWSSNPIDRFVIRRLREHGLMPAGQATASVLLRRLSYDLTGLPPGQFDLSADGETLSEAQYAAVVDRLLASPQFGVAWGRHWLDLVRYAETLGHEFDYPVYHAWRYRDAVVNAFNIDLRYDRLLVEHIAGDQVPEPRIHPLSGMDQSLLMTGFWWLGDSVHAPTDIQSDWATRVDNQIDVVSKAFMGMTVACARCHDHKFDAIRMQDYYGLAGIVESTRRVYAITDPQSQGLKHRRVMQAKQQAADVAALQAIESAFGTPHAARRWVESLVDRLAGLSRAERQELLPQSSLFFPLLACFEDDSQADQDPNWRAQILRTSRKYQEWKSRSPLFATFEEGVPEGWSVDGLRDDGLQDDSQLDSDLLCGLGMSNMTAPASATPAFDWYSREFPLPLKVTAFSSQRFGLMQQVVLQSPVFPIEYPMVCVKLRGKSAQSALVIDNYFMNEFHQLLFGDTRKPIDQPQDGEWWVHSGDLRKYLGQTAYLSFEDYGEGWFEIEEVRFSTTAPPEQPSSQAITILEANDLGKDRLLDLVSEELARAFEHFRQGERDGDSIAAIRQALSLGDDLELCPTASDELAAHLVAFRNLDSSARQPTLVLAAAESTPRDTAVALRGNPKQRGEPVPRRCLPELISQSPQVDSASSGRWELAETLTQPDHPLTARVAVNRVWYYLMGRGIVASTDNLGVLGGRPSHPELLDYLAVEFVRHDWSVKWLVREIVMSQTYRLTSRASSIQLELDPTASLYSHRRLRRLSAESIRDSLLAAAGEINLVLGGPSVAVHLSDEMTGRGRPQRSGPLDGEGRRSLFLEVRRNFLDPLLLAFDFPMPATAVGNRTRSNVPAQALGLLNAPFVDEMSQRCVLHEAVDARPAERVGVIFQAVYGRGPSSDELDRCLSFIDQVGEEGWRDLVHTLFNSKEFLFLR